MDCGLMGFLLLLFLSIRFSSFFHQFSQQQQQYSISYPLKKSSWGGHGNNNTLDIHCMPLVVENVQKGCSLERQLAPLEIDFLHLTLLRLQYYAHLLQSKFHGSPWGLLLSSCVSDWAAYYYTLLRVAGLKSRRLR